MSDDQPQDRRSVFERHFQTAIQIVLIAIVSWAGVQLVNLGQASAVLQERLTTQGALLNELRIELKEWSEIYYRKADARRELDDIQNRIDGLHSRVTELEVKVK